MPTKFTASLLLGLLAGLAARGAPPLVTVSADGRLLSGTADFSIPHSHRQLSFHIENSPAGKNSLQRFRYRLEGVDDDWREDPSIALFYAGFYNADGDRISLWQHEVSGKSAGWVSTPDDSSFTHRMATLTVPADAQSVKFSVSTAGQPTGVGVFVVTNVAVVLSAQHPPLRFPSSQWLADGTRPSMALLLTLQNNPTLDRALSIWDADIIGHAEWRTKNGLKVKPGQTFTVEWDELCNLGFGIPLNENYPKLRPGQYRFFAQRLNILGQPVDQPAVMLLQITPPFWQSGWFITAVSLAGLGAVLAGFRYYLYLKLKRQRATLRLIEQERLRIAQDLHDDLGARMTHMALISAQAKTSLADNQCRASLLEISGLMKESVAALSRTVWAVNPKNDHLDALAAFLCRMVQSECCQAGLRCRINASIIEDRRAVPSEMRHHIVLALREAVNNALKHAAADELSLTVKFENATLTVTLADNGRGFTVSDASHDGNGLANMKSRLEKFHGTVQIVSVSGGGATVRFSIPIPNGKQP